MSGHLCSLLEPPVVFQVMVMPVARQVTSDGAFESLLEIISLIGTLLSLDKRIGEIVNVLIYNESGHRIVECL